MTNRNHRLVALLTTLLYVVSGMLIEVSHHDATHFLLGSKPIVEQHSCGVTEIHVEWGHVHHCLACSHFAQRFTTETKVFSVLDSAVTFIAALPSDIGRTLDTDVLHSGKRGPPEA